MNRPALQTIDVQGSIFKTSDNPRYARFWEKLRTGRWRELDTIAFITKNCDSDTVLYDIGAWIGPISLMAGARGATVYALEPDPVAHDALLQNIGSNAFRITAINKAVSTDGAPLTLYVKKEQGDSETSAIATNGTESMVVDTVRLADLPGKESRQRKIVKVDIEGYEYRLRSDLAEFCRDAVALHLSFHPRNLQHRTEAWRETSALVAELADVFQLSKLKRTGLLVKAAACCFAPRPHNFHVIFSRARA